MESSRIGPMRNAVTSIARGWLNTEYVFVNWLFKLTRWGWLLIKTMIEKRSATLSGYIYSLDICSVSSYINYIWCPLLPLREWFQHNRPTGYNPRHSGLNWMGIAKWLCFHYRVIRDKHLAFETLTTSLFAIFYRRLRDIFRMNGDFSQIGH